MGGWVGVPLARLRMQPSAHVHAALRPDQTRPAEAVQCSAVTLHAAGASGPGQARPAYSMQLLAPAEVEGTACFRALYAVTACTRYFERALRCAHDTLASAHVPTLPCPRTPCVRSWPAPRCAPHTTPPSPHLPRVCMPKMHACVLPCPGDMHGRSRSSTPTSRTSTWTCKQTCCSSSRGRAAS